MTAVGVGENEAALQEMARLLADGAGVAAGDGHCSTCYEMMLGLGSIDAQDGVRPAVWSIWWNKKRLETT